MSFTEIVVLLIAAALIGRLPRYRTWAMLAVSVMGIFWLQPAEPLRFLGFLLPLATVALTAAAWLITSDPENRTLRAALPTAVVLLLCVLAAQATRLLQVPLPAAEGAPGLAYALPILAATAIFLVACHYWRSSSKAILVILALTIIAGFVVLKTPSLVKGVAPLFSGALSLNIAEGSVAPLVWLGYSYMAFRILHTIRDRQAGRLPAVSLREYVTYVCFFPAFTAGPIDRLERFVPEMRAPLPMGQEDALRAGGRVLLGLFKKFVLADLLAGVSINGALVPHVHSSGWLWVFLYAYSFRIYLDFSGYTDVAIGMGRLMGIQLPENFRSPYLQPNLAQFWNSWHITLTEWFRAYVFNPFTRAMRARRSRLPAWIMILSAQLLTMLLIGLWHGIALGFVLWGLWHAVGLFVHNRWLAWCRGRMPKWLQSGAGQRWGHVLGVLLTFHYVAAGWLFFVLSAPLAWSTLGQMIGAA